MGLSQATQGEAGPSLTPPSSLPPSVYTLSVPEFSVNPEVGGASCTSDVCFGMELGPAISVHVVA